MIARFLEWVAYADYVSITKLWSTYHKRLTRPLLIDNIHADPEFAQYMHTYLLKERILGRF